MPDEEEHECPVCDRVFDSKMGLAAHTAAHDGNPLQVDCECNYCEETFQRPRSQVENGVGKYCSKECKSKDQSVDCVCDVCGEEYTLYQSDYEQQFGKYCSMECRSEDNTVTCECRNCGEEFSVAQSDYDDGRGAYCSRECRIEYGQVQCECVNCGEEFSEYRSISKKRKDDFCSTECKYEYNRVRCTCENCGDTFTVWKSQYENGVGKYCSQECFGEDRRIDNPDLRHSPEYDQWREDVLDRDGHQCVDCGSEDYLHVHHTIPVSETELFATDLLNGVTLCVECHANRHEERDETHTAALIRGLKS